MVQALKTRVSLESMPQLICMYLRYHPLDILIAIFTQPFEFFRPMVVYSLPVVQQICSSDILFKTVLTHLNISEYRFTSLVLIQTIVYITNFILQIFLFKDFG